MLAQSFAKSGSVQACFVQARPIGTPPCGMPAREAHLTGEQCLEGSSAWKEAVAGRELWLGGSCAREGVAPEKQLRLRAVHVPPARIAVPVWVSGLPSSPLALRSAPAHSSSRAAVNLSVRKPVGFGASLLPRPRELEFIDAQLLRQLLLLAKSVADRFGVSALQLHRSHSAAVAADAVGGHRDPLSANLSPHRPHGGRAVRLRRPSGRSSVSIKKERYVRTRGGPRLPASLSVGVAFSPEASCPECFSPSVRRPTPEGQDRSVRPPAKGPPIPACPRARDRPRKCRSGEKR